MIRRAFTLIELLVVIAIIVLLTSLILGVGYPYLRWQANSSLTQRRMDAVIQGVTLYTSAGNTDGMESLFTLTTGKSLRMGSLRTVMETLQRDFNLDITDRTKVRVGLRRQKKADGSLWETGWWSLNRPPERGNLPPNLGCRAELKNVSSNYANPSGNTPASWRLAGSGLDYEIAYLHRQRREYKIYPCVAVDCFGYDVGYEISGGMFQGSRSEQLDTQAKKNETRASYNISPIGETLDATLERLPDATGSLTGGQWSTQDFYDRWPTMDESIVSADGQPITDASKLKYNQQAQYYTAAELAQYTEEDRKKGKQLTPIWPWPWGQRKLNRAEQIQVDDVQEGSLRDMSPLRTMGLLQVASLLRDDASYRTNREKKQSWNDAWGRPLVIAAAIHHAPRFDFQTAATVMENGTNARAETHLEVKGPRDLFIQKAVVAYGAYRGIYLVIATARMRTSAKPWAATADSDVLAEIWTTAQDAVGVPWTEASWGSPPWGSVIIKGRDDQSAFLTKPFYLPDRSNR